MPKVSKVKVIMIGYETQKYSIHPFFIAWNSFKVHVKLLIGNIEIITCSKLQFFSLSTLLCLVFPLAPSRGQVLLSDASQYDFKVYLTRGMKNKLTPVIISIDFALAEGETEMQHLSNQPVIRINGDKHVTKSINIKNNCRLHNFCDDNLKGWIQNLFRKSKMLFFSQKSILKTRKGRTWKV